MMNTIQSNYRLPREDQSGVFAVIWNPESNSVLMPLRVAEFPEKYRGKIREFPGGGLEAHEQDCWVGICRETYEEVGLDLRDSSLFRLLCSTKVKIPKKNNHHYIQLFLIQCFSNTLTFDYQRGKTVEADDARWIPISEIEKQELSESFRKSILPALWLKLLDPPL